MGLNCMETYIRLYGFLPVWFEWKGNSRLERIGEVEMGGASSGAEKKGAWYDVPRPFLSGERNNHDGVRHTGRNAAKCLSAHTNRPLASPLSTVPLS